eukprot:scpid43709/ scgid4309/ 
MMRKTADNDLQVGCMTISMFPKNMSLCCTILFVAASSSHGAKLFTTANSSLLTLEWNQDIDSTSVHPLADLDVHYAYTTVLSRVYSNHSTEWPGTSRGVCVKQVDAAYRT